MFTVRRTTSSSITGNALRCQKHDFSELSSAIECFEGLRRADALRYNILMTKHREMFFDNSYCSYEYHYTVGSCEIYCRIEGLYEDAYDEFYMKFQEDLQDDLK